MSTLSSINKIVVFGGGQMGSGIAQVSAQNNYQVCIIDTNKKSLQTSETTIRTSLQRISKKLYPTDQLEADLFIDTVLSRIQFATSSDLETESKILPAADLVIEAIIENLTIKKNLFERLDEVCDDKTVFATNTSSLQVGDIAAATSDSRRHRFLGLHFFNPVPQMKLVEVVRTDHVVEEVVGGMTEFVKSLGKVPVFCKDTPGFIVNRLLVPYMLEATKLVERGEASKEDVDTAMKLGAGYPMGPFELMDYVGLDTIKFILDGWYENSKDLKGKEFVKPSHLIENLVKEGKLGKKSGEGFFKYSMKPKM